MNCINCTDANGDKVLSTSERRFVEVNRSIQSAILGKQVADAIKKAPSTWNEMMSNGKGPVYETCQILRKIEEEGRFENIFECETARQNIVDIICKYAGRVAVKPILRHERVDSFAQLLSELSESFSKSIDEIRKAIDVQSDGGHTITAEEFRVIEKWLMELVKDSLSGIEWARADMKSR